MYEILILLVFALNTGASGGTVNEKDQVPLAISHSREDMPSDTILKLCPESNHSDILKIGRIISQPLVPFLDDVVDVLIWGNFTRDISANSTVDYQINATANNGDSGALNGTFPICDYLDQMHQPPDSNEIEKACPPTEGPVFIDYAMWFADWLVAPGQWSFIFDAKTPEGDRIYCLEAKLDLQCPPWHDGPECLREERDAVGGSERLRRLRERVIRTRGLAKRWPLMI